MRLQFLQQVVHGELGVSVVEADDHPERDHVVAHGIDERPAELAVLRGSAQRPAHRVDDAIERTRDLPDLLHAERPHLRVLARQPVAVERDARQMSLRPLGEHGDASDDVGAGLEVAELVAVAAAALVARAHAAHSAVRREQLHRGRLGEDHPAGPLRLSRKPAAELRQRRDVVPLVLHRRRRGDAHRSLRREEVHRLVLDRPVEGHLVEPLAAFEKPPQRARVDDRARQQVRAGLLALLEHGDGHVAEPFADRGCVLQQLPQADRAREPGRACADDHDAYLDALVLRVRRRRDVVPRVERRRIVGGPHEPLRALTSSVSFGTTSCTSPTTPRSENSKIGAFESLLIATITPADCIPTLCWIAPEMPQAMYSFGATLFPVCPTCVAYGYHPASTTARVAPTAPPSAFASSSTSVKFSGPPRPRPPATITSASSIDGPELSSCA